VFSFIKSFHPDTPVATYGAVHITSVIVKHVMASAAEAEFAGLFYNAQEACSFRHTLEELGHPQPPTAIQTDNECANGIANDTVKQRRSKSMDMRFYWIRDRIQQGQFLVHWKPVLSNQADYFIKHHSPSHHQTLRNTYLQGNAFTNLHNSVLRYLILHESHQNVKTLKKTHNKLKPLLLLRFRLHLSFCSF
jgi:hypothetical protein